MANRDFQWFRFWATEWATDDRVIEMPAMAKGCFIQLLCSQWVNGSLPEDPLCIARHAGLTDYDVRAASCEAAYCEDGRDANDVDLLGIDCTFKTAIWQWLEELFPICSDGRRRNERLEDERSATSRKKRSDNERTEEARKARSRRKSAKRKALNSVTLNVTEDIARKTQSDNERTEEARKARSRKSAKRKGLNSVTLNVTEDIARLSLSSSSLSSSEEEDAGARSSTEVLKWWNTIAERFDLPLVQKLTQSRLRALKARLREYPEFSTQLETALSKRSRWWRERRMPTYDQATRESFCVKLFEGHCEVDYDSPQTTSAEDKEEAIWQEARERAYGGGEPE